MSYMQHPKRVLFAYIDLGLSLLCVGAPPNPSQSGRDGSGPCDKWAYLLSHTLTLYMQSLELYTVLKGMQSCTTQ